jgi:hypothetical protein
MTDLRPDPSTDPVLAAKNRRLGLAILGVVMMVMFFTYLQRGALFHVLFKVG